MVYARPEAPEPDQNDLTFGVSGYLLRDALVMYDHQTDSLWSQFLGEAIDGPMDGNSLELLPSRITSWAQWRVEHPDGTAMDKQGMGPFPALSFVFDPEAAMVVGELTPEGISSHDLVLGVVVNESPVAFALKELVYQRVLNLEVDGVPLVAVAVEGFSTGSVFERTLDGEVLSFAPGAEGTMTDGGGSRWDLASGVATDGAHAGDALTRLRAVRSFWFAWQAYNPDTTLRLGYFPSLINSSR
jgi:hypothetical protein